MLVTDCWLANAGDAALALATEQAVRRAAPGAAVLHAAYQGDLLGDRYPELEMVPPLSALLGTEFAPPSPEKWSGEHGLGLVADADLVVSQGGGFLLEHYQPWERLFALARVIELGKPLVLLGQGIGHFRLARARALMRAIVRGAHAVSVRDEHSYDHVIDLGADADRVRLTGDLTWLLVSPTRQSSEHVGVGVLLTQHEHAPDNALDRQALSNEVLSEVLSRTGDETITIASTVQGLAARGFEDDTSTAEAAVAALPAAQRARVAIVEGYLTAEQALARFGSCRAVVTQRLHPAVFALAQGVPAALLLGGDKAAVLDGAGVDALVCRRPDDPLARARSLDGALRADAIRGAELVERLGPAIQRSQQNVDVIRQVLAGVVPAKAR